MKVTAKPDASITISTATDSPFGHVTISLEAGESCEIESPELAEWFQFVIDNGSFPNAADRASERADIIARMFQRPLRTIDDLAGKPRGSFAQFIAEAEAEFGKQEAERIQRIRAFRDSHK